MKKTKVDYSITSCNKDGTNKTVHTGSSFMYADRLCGDSAAIEELIQVEKLPIDTWEHNIEVNAWEITNETWQW